MTIRDKLIEIIRNSDECYDCCHVKIEYLADRIIESGLIVNDKVYGIKEIERRLNPKPPICVKDIMIEKICGKCEYPLDFNYGRYCKQCGAKLKE